MTGRCGCVSDDEAFCRLLAWASKILVTEGIHRASRRPFAGAEK